MNKILYREDVEKLVPGLLYSQNPNVTLLGKQFACRSVKFDSFERAIKFLNDNVGCIIFFDHIRSDVVRDSDVPMIDATTFLVRFADLTEVHTKFSLKM